MTQTDLLLSDLRYSKGDRIADRYVIDRQVGEGGMGVVYKALDTLVDEEVALKFMNPQTLRTQKGQQMFIQEAQVARRLRHDNIVAVHDVSTTVDGVLYLSMEFVEGRSLRQFLRKNRAERRHLEVRLAVEITLQILAALEYAHRMVVHRDLKPENVMLLPGERAKVLDFGLAVIIEEEEERGRRENDSSGKPKRVIGTAAYSAPEQKRHGAIDGRADLYTVGLLLHELLTLRTPRDQPVTVVEARQDVAPSIIRVLDTALVEDRERRWQTAKEFREALGTAYEESYRSVTVAEVETDSGRTVSTDGMAFFEGGSFIMGCKDVREESPEFEVSLEPFYLDKHPVTVGEYEEFLEAVGREEPKFWHDPEFNGPRQPISGVTWEDARAYAHWQGKELPSEAQWEFAARGRDNRLYPWGSYDPDPTRCNFGDYLGMPSIVTMHDLGATPEGVFDLAGNIYEWTLGAFTPYKPGAGANGFDPKAQRRVARGGSWHSPPFELRTSNRKGLFPESQLTTVGFRCALSAGRVPGSPSSATEPSAHVSSP